MPDSVPQRAASDDVIIFIDTCAYLDFYRTGKSRQLLKSLLAQSKYIFVTQQVANEVLRNKLDVAEGYLGGKIEIPKFKITPGLFDESIHEKLSNQAEGITNGVREFARALKDATSNVLDSISKSDDDISKALDTVFGGAVRPSTDERERAQERKALGNSPGKAKDALGDQLSWEQLKTHLEGKSKLWLISHDGDYCTKYNDDSFFLNPMLRRELGRIEVFCFGTLSDGIRDFAKYNGAGKEELPSDAEMVEIKAEETLSAAESMPFVYSMEPMPRPQFRARFIHRPEMDQVGWISVRDDEENQNGRIVGWPSLSYASQSSGRE